MNIKIKNIPILIGVQIISLCVFFHFTNNGAQNISEQISLYYVLIFLNAQSLEWYCLVNIHMHFKSGTPTPRFPSANTANDKSTVSLWGCPIPLPVLVSFNHFHFCQSLGKGIDCHVCPDLHLLGYY